MTAGKQTCRQSAISIALGSCLAIVIATPVGAESLLDALSQAYATNPTLQAARATLRATDELVPQALSDWRPQADIVTDGAFGREERSSREVGGARKENFAEFEAEFSVNQFLFRGGRTIANTRRAEALVEAQRSDLIITEQDTHISAATAYMDVWRDQKILGFQNQNVAALREQVAAAKEQFRLRQVTVTDVSQTESRLARGLSDQADAQRALASSRALYKEVIGSVPEMVEDPPPLPTLPPSREDVIAIAIEDNPIVPRARQLEVAERQNVRSRFAELLPEVSVGGSVSHEKETARDDASDDARVFGVVRFPIYERGLVSSRVREAKQVANQRRIEIEEARRSAEAEAKDSWEAWRAAQIRIEQFTREVELTEIALEGTREEVDAGVRLVIDILDALQEVVNANSDLARAQRDEVVTRLFVLRAMGTLTARTLALEVDVYDPGQHYESVRKRWYGFGEMPYISDW